ncbi:looped-hinge helix DNA binding domain, AbrB family [Metallosphaera yellowstonensis MK1]|jgi:AbrB family looped-hinge helix DNA binding protein|uniref:Looped-hinge helix DNA binding domain, AbrB family n=1 Tax=Metallosphaera yellowstonensis MK1 TaxID=671065 RepID=H2C243_9CREN|nr:AbrB/MazE/SpoVT family DNA-binding domain-containing protein [Metallosphaera yellowstonensis]EHP70314.1 looped-hinge helix DNA binding domain, AbrB family [Metallosphaera yellowstonensis MK1]
MDVKVHKKGMIVIPAEVRRKVNIKEDSKLEIKVKGNEMVLRPKLTLLEAFGIDEAETGRLLLRELRGGEEKGK